MSNRTYYVVCEDNCRFESMTKEQILTAITQAVESHTITDVNTGFVTTLKEQNANKGLKMWVGTQAQYNALETTENNCIYWITDDATGTQLTTAVNTAQAQITALSGKTGKALLDDEIDLTSTTIPDLSELFSNYNVATVLLKTADPTDLRQKYITLNLIKVSSSVFVGTGATLGVRTNSGVRDDVYSTFELSITKSNNTFSITLDEYLIEKDGTKTFREWTCAGTENFSAEITQIYGIA